MHSSAFNLAEDLHNKKLYYNLSRFLWGQFASPNVAIDLSFGNWRNIKYLNSTCTDFHPDITSVPNDKGGLYLFFVKCDIIPGLTEFPLYLGRAQLTENQNLRKRVKEYFQKYSNSKERPKIFRMFQYWSEDLYLAFMALDTNSEIIEFEKKLINSLLLPMNDQIPDQIIRDAVKAFS